MLSFGTVQNFLCRIIYYIILIATTCSFMVNIVCYMVHLNAVLIFFSVLRGLMDMLSTGTEEILDSIKHIHCVFLSVSSQHFTASI